MRIRSVLTLTAIVLATAAAAAPAAEPAGPAPQSAADEALIRELEAKSWAAWKARDGAFFEQFLSDDHVEVHGFGIAAKAAVVEGVRSTACSVQSYALGPLTLTPVTPDTVLVTYRAEQDTRCGNARVPSPVWATSLYVRRAGRWLNLLYQHTPVS
jgi:hypothetical protein